MTITNYLTIDVEDYYQVSAFEAISPPSTWAGRESRVERNTDLVLSLLDEHAVKATFFVLGWIAERFPQLTHRIAAQGHEIASHGFMHQRVSLLDRKIYRQDIRRSKTLLEDQIGQAVLGYRAPSYSITKQTDWAFDELVEAGYQYDSSIFPIKHDFYGMSEWPRYAGFAEKTTKGDWCPAETPDALAPRLWEIPISTVRFAGRNFPIAGGGYFRLFPYFVTRAGLQRINHSEEKPFIFYLHPWEVDPAQPRMQGVGLKSRFRHYLNLHKTETRFRQLLKDFQFAAVRDVSPEYCHQANSNRQITER